MRSILNPRVRTSIVRGILPHFHCSRSQRWKNLRRRVNLSESAVLTTCVPIAFVHSVASALTEDKTALIGSGSNVKLTRETWQLNHNSNDTNGFSHLSSHN